MSLYETLKLAHLLSGAVLFGTGLGIAYFMLAAWRARDAAHAALTARQVVIADVIFTATAVVAQPATGIGLIVSGGWAWDAPWLLWAYGLYALAGACWLPVVWIQMRCAKLAAGAAEAGAPLPAAFHHLMRLWFALGWPAFAAVAAIYALMVVKPS